MHNITKNQQAINYYLEGNIKKSFAIFKTFRLCFNQEEKRLFEISYEIISGNDLFYKQLGYDTNSIVVKTNKIAKNYINQHLNKQK